MSDLESNTVAVETKLPLDISKTKLTSKTTDTHFIQHEDGNSNDSGIYTANLSSFQTKTITEQDDGVLDLSCRSKVNTNASTISTAPTVLNDNVLLNPFSNSIKKLPFDSTSAFASKGKYCTRQICISLCIFIQFYYFLYRFFNNCR